MTRELQQNMLRRYRTGVTTILRARNDLHGERDLYNALGLGNPDVPGALTQADIDAVFGANSVTLQQFKDAMVSMNALDTFLIDNFHVSNLFRIKEA